MRDWPSTVMLIGLTLFISSILGMMLTGGIGAVFGQGAAFHIVGTLASGGMVLGIPVLLIGLLMGAWTMYLNS